MNPSDLTFEQLIELWPAQRVEEACAQGDERAIAFRAWLSSEEGQRALAAYQVREQRIIARLSDVPVPQDGPSRLLRLWEQASASSSERSAKEDETTLASPASLSQPSKPERSSTHSARWLWVSTAASLLLVLAGSVAAWRYWFEPRPMGRTEVAQSSLIWARQLDSRLWQSIDPQVVRRAPVPEELGASPVRFGVIPTDWDQTTIVYDLSGPEQQIVLLYVIDVGRPFEVPNRFHLSPDYTTSQFAVGSMQREGRLYVLMVEGDARKFRQTIRSVGPLG